MTQAEAYLFHSLRFDHPHGMNRALAKRLIVRTANKYSFSLDIASAIGVSVRIGGYSRVVRDSVRVGFSCFFADLSAPRDESCYNLALYCTSRENI